MNKWEVEVQQSLLDSEKAAIKELEKQYAAALKDINEKVRLFQADIDLLDQALNQDGLDEATKRALLSQKRSKVYQQQYQQALKNQIGGIIDKLHSDSYATIDKYLKQCYEDGYIGTMYDIAKQGIPIIAPIDQAAMVRAILTDSKIVEGYYKHLGVNYAKLKKVITQEVSRGIATSLPYADIARNINNASNSGLYNAKCIARTEGHRIQQTSTRDAQWVAKSRGANVLKQWDATLDGRTRPSHARIDGEIRETDEKYSNGLMFPGDPSGPAAEVINCRCVSKTRARWALDEDELQKLQDRANFFGLDKTKNFAEFKEKYLAAVKKLDLADTDYMSASFRPVFGNKEVTTTVAVDSDNGVKRVTMYLKKVTNSSFELFADPETTRRSKAIRLTEKNLLAIQQELPREIKVPDVAVVDFEKHGFPVSAIGAYDRKAKILFMNSQYDTKAKIEDYLKENAGWFASQSVYAPYKHEIGHSYYEKIVAALAKREGLDYNKAKERVDAVIQNFVHTQAESGKSLDKELSNYADYSYKKHKFSEIVAECFSVNSENQYAGALLDILGGGLF